MRKFIFKLSCITFLAILSTIPLLNFYGVFDSNIKLSFVSNNIATNAKSYFILQNKAKFSTAKFVIVGSSMSLNNIDGVYFEKLINKNTINISAWEMKICDFKDYVTYINPNSQIIINICFTDFNKTILQKYSNFPFGNKYLFFNKIINFRGFIAQRQQIVEYSSPLSNTTYNYLNFDKTGSVVYAKDNFNVSSDRWEDTRKIPSDKELDDFVSQLAMFKGYKIYLFFSPERSKYKSIGKKNAIAKLENLIKNRYSNVSFYNNYCQDFNDSLFVDCYHFNSLGALRYTQLIFAQIDTTKNRLN